MNDIGEKITGVVAAIIGLAVLAIVISTRANTANVLGAFFGGLSNLISVAISPVTGASTGGINTAGLSGGTWQGASSGASNYAAASGGGFNPLSLISGLGGSLGGLGGGLGGLGGGGGTSGGGLNIGSLLGSVGGSGITSAGGAGLSSGIIDAGLFA